MKSKKTSMYGLLNENRLSLLLKTKPVYTYLFFCFSLCTRIKNVINLDISIGLAIW